MNQTGKVQIIGIDDGDILERIDSQLRSLILSTERAIPGSRGFGLKDNFLDLISPDAVNEFGIELEEKEDKFIPEISIAGIYLEPDINGDNVFQIYVEWRDDYDSGN